jgi:hypothetical protein
VGEALNSHSEGQVYFSGYEADMQFLLRPSEFHKGICGRLSATAG